MKTLKKLFSVSAIIALAGTLVPMYAFGSTYGDELEAAYTYAHKKGVTTMSSIDNADMYGSLTRIALAKMIANYAQEVLKLEPDTTKACSFPDVSAELDKAYDNGVKRACQLGLMGVGITKFDPNSSVTRAQFGTTFSRALNANDADKVASMNKATPRYKEHLAYLNDKGIMKDISNPDQREVRGYVMLMMMRADEATAAAEGCSATELLACLTADDYDACIAKCAKPEDVVKAGDLKVTAKPSEDRKVLIGGTSDLDTLSFRADRAITLEKVVLERFGFSKADDIDAVWLENENGTKITNERGLNSKDEVTLSINKDYRSITKKADLVLAVRTKAGVSAGTLGFKVKDVVSSAKRLNLSDYDPYKYDMINYTGNDLKLTVKGKDKTYHYTANTSYEVARLQVKAADAAILAKGFTLDKGASTLDLDRYVDKVEVSVNGEAVKGLKYKVTRDDIKVSFNDVKIGIKKNVMFAVNVTLKDLDRFDKAIELKIKDAGDFNAIEEKTSVRASILGTPAAFKKYTFQGGEIRLTNNKLPAIVDGAAGSVNVVIGEGKIELGGEAIVLNDFTIVTDKTGIDTMKLFVNNEEFEATRNAAKTGFTFKNVFIEKSSDLTFKVDVDSEVTGGTLISTNDVFNKTLLQDAFPKVGRYDETGEPVLPAQFIGSINLSNVKVQAAKGSLVNDLTKKIEFIAEQSSRATIFDGEYSAQKQDIKLNDLTIKSNIALIPDESINFNVYINDRQVGSIDLQAGDKEDSTTFSDVLIKKGEKAKVKVEANVYLNNSTKQTYNLTLKGEDVEGNVAGESNADCVEIEGITNGSVIVSANADSTVLLRKSNTSLAKFNVKANPKTIGAVSLSGVTFDIISSGQALNSGNIKVKVDGTELDYNDNFKIDGTKIELFGLSNDLSDNGIDVEVLSKGELTGGVYTLKLAKVNNATPNKVFKKNIMDAVIKVVKQEGKKDETKYTLSVEKYDDSVSVSGFQFDTITGGVLPLSSIADNDTFELPNGDAVKYIEEIKYSINNAPVVTIKKSEYKEFFKVGDTFVKIFKAQ